MSGSTAIAPADRAPDDAPGLSRLPLSVALIWILALGMAIIPWLDQVHFYTLVQSFWTVGDGQYNQILLHYSWAPRFAMAILIGCGLGLAGAVLQQVLGNPLASPSTLGVEAGAQLAIAVATLYAPTVLAFSPDLTAVSGGMLAAGMVVALTWRMGFSPVTVILAGLVVTFFLGALNAAFLLFHGEYLGNLFIWGAGSLAQNDWSQFSDLWPRVLILGLALILLIKPLQLLQLGTDSARSLGARVGLLRLLALFLVVLMTASVVSRVGVVAFIGLAAPVTAKLLGARTLRQRLAWSTLIGGGLMLLADTLAQWATDLAGGNLVPTGTTTALIGGPIILLAMRGLRNNRHMPTNEAGPGKLITHRRALAPILVGLFLLLGCVIVLALGWAPGKAGWHWTSPVAWSDIWTWRGPRLLASLAAGAALGLAGTIVQRFTGNVMASPEVLGISGGAALGMMILVLAGIDAGRGTQLLAGAAGSGAVMFLLLGLSRKYQFAGHQLLLGGVAIYVFTDAGLRLIMAGGGTDAMQLLNWLAGSTWLVTSSDAIALIVVTLILSALVLVAHRALSLLSLGPGPAAALGLDVRAARLLLLLLAAALTAAATLVIGPLSFVGLMAPHLARVLGQQTVGRQLIVAAGVGALLLAFADYLARVLLYPNQLPAGLLAALVGGAYFLWGLSRNGRHSKTS